MNLIKLNIQRFASQTTGVSNPASPASNFDNTAQLKMDYINGDGEITITQLAGKRDYSPSYCDGYSLRVYFNDVEHTISLQKQVYFANGSFREWDPHYLSVSGLSGNTTVVVKMPDMSFTGRNKEFTFVIDAGSSVRTPSVNQPSVSNITSTSAYASFTVADSGGANIVDHYMDLSLTNFGTTVATVVGASGTFAGLNPATRYYIRANASNGTYRGYSSVGYFTTSEEPPKNLSISDLDSVWADIQQEVCITGTLHATHGTGSTGNINYKVYYKRSIDSSYTVYSLGQTTSESKNFILNHLQADMDYDIYFTATSSGGTTTSSVSTVRTTTVTFVYVSINGGEFVKRKMYFNQSAGAWYLAYNKNIHIEHGE